MTQRGIMGNQSSQVRGPGPLLEDGVSADRSARGKDSMFCSEEAEVRWEENQVGIHFLREKSG